MPEHPAPVPAPDAAVPAPAPARPDTPAPARPGTPAPARPGTPAPARPGTEALARRDPRWRRTLAAVGVVVVAATAFVVVTASTGLDAPGPLRRHPERQLTALVERIHEVAGEIRTPDDCWRTLRGADGPLREVARVDHLRSRVVVRAWASDDGQVDFLTNDRVTHELDAIINADPDLSWDMVIVEASPDGWSPVVNCARITRGPVTGF